MTSEPEKVEPPLPEEKPPLLTPREGLPPYEQWKEDPSPENLNKVVEHLRPVINYQLANLGSGQDPLMRSKARVAAARAVQSYDPSYGAALPTWVSRQMMQLRREKRKANQVLKVPERMQIEGYHLNVKELEFLDKHGREPDLLELADFAKLPVKRIEAIRKNSRATPAEAAVQDTGTYLPDFGDEAMDYIYRDADYIDRKILEHKAGLGGAKILPPQEIAARYKVSPSQISRRAARLALKIEKMRADLEAIS